jgi:osmotically-inducible protein OsmY
LQCDTREEQTVVCVEVDQGVVTLTGTVSSWGKKMAAQEAAHRVSGVLDVANDLDVVIPGIGRKTDTEIAQSVRQALEWDVFVPDTKIRTTITNGWVTLEGDVDTVRQKEDAGHAIKNLAGVRGISNNLEVNPPIRLVAQDVRTHIEQALERQAEREAKRIVVDVKDGQVTMTGLVHSWAERDAVLGAARGTQGVRNVNDQIRVNPYA